MERDELRTTLVNHLETLRRNLQVVSMEVLKTKYKKPFDALRQDICKAATAYTRFLVFDGMRIKHKYFDEAVPYIDTAVKQTKRLKQISDAAFQRQDIDEIESLRPCPAQRDRSSSAALLYGTYVPLCDAGML